MQKTKLLILIALLAYPLASCEQQNPNDIKSNAPSLSIVEKKEAQRKLPKNTPMKADEAPDMLIPPQQKAISSDNKKIAGKWALSKADCQTNNSFILTNDGKYISDEEEGNWSLNGNNFAFSTENEEMINDKPTMKKRVVKMTLQKVTSENVVLQRTDGSNVLWLSCK